MPTQVFHERIQTVFWMTRFILIHRQTNRRVSPAPSTQSEVLLSIIWFLLLSTIWFSKEYWISYSWIFMSVIPTVCMWTYDQWLLHVVIPMIIRSSTEIQNLPTEIQNLHSKYTSWGGGNRQTTNISKSNMSWYSTMKMKSISTSKSSEDLIVHTPRNERDTVFTCEKDGRNWSPPWF